MKVHQIRNATIIIEYQNLCLLVDPMLAEKGKIPSLRYLTANKRRNPLVDLPSNTTSLLNGVTHCLITHCQKGHFDHLDRAGGKWLKSNNIPVLCSEQDSAFLSKRSFETHELKIHNLNTLKNGNIELVSCLHGTGVVGKLMAHGVGYFINMPNEPSIYITGDTILTPHIVNFVKEKQPDIIVAPAGGAKFDLGGEVIMNEEEAIQLALASDGKFIANHLEALDHCPVTRKDLRALATLNKLNHRFYIPKDGETLEFIN